MLPEGAFSFFKWKGLSLKETVRQNIVSLNKCFYFKNLKIEKLQNSIIKLYNTKLNQLYKCVPSATLKRKKEI